MRYNAECDSYKSIQYLIKLIDCKESTLIFSLQSLGDAYVECGYNMLF